MALSSPGIGSNLDVNSIVSQLMAVESQPLAFLRKRESAYQTELSAYGSLKSVLASFQTSVQDLSSPVKLQANRASVADSGILSASADTSAVAGSYSVEVQQLAQQQKVGSAGFANVTDVVGTGTLTFKYGSYDSGSNAFTPNSAKPAQTVTIDAAHNTLGGIRDAINAANIGVSATLVNDGSANRLVLTSRDSGSANSLRLTVSDNDATNTDTSGLSQLAFDPTAPAGSGKNLAQAVAAQDAILKIDGITVTKPSNTLTDAIEGVKLSLLKTNLGSTTTLTVARDDQAVQASVEAFVKAYNGINTTIRNLTAYDAATRTGSPLQGDASTLAIQRQLRSVLSSPVSGLSGSLTTLSQIGIAFQKDGSLALDSAKLQKAIDNNFGDVSSLFAAAGNTLDSLASGYLSSDGTLSSRTDGINSSIKDLENRKDALNRRLADIEKRYRAQFTALDTMISSMAQTSSFLTQQLANLSKNNA